ncbi:MAG: hypothetical protein QW062_05370 [Thermoplasmatales archaeon]
MKLLENSSSIFQRHERKTTQKQELQLGITRLKYVIIEINTENLSRKKDRKLQDEKMTSMFYDIKITIETTTSRILSILRIS